ISILDGTPAADAAPITLTVNEAALSTAGATGSNPGLTTESDSLPALSFTAGSDALSSFAFSTDLSHLVSNLDGAGTDIVWVRDSATQITGHLGTAAGAVAITLTLTAPANIAPGATGSVTVTATLSDDLPHELANAAQTQSLGYAIVQASDNDGDTANGQVNVSVTDDVPTLTVSDTPTSVVEGGTANGTWALTPGADGVSAVTVTFG
ncbi:hypothetical protein, partial [Sphingobium bisphenolivorans]|uniref:hypothetical protein n=1 Tax=Sphingobium bisphenolivorans TaxID=1335760 RepID=UPI00055F64E1